MNDLHVPRLIDYHMHSGVTIDCRMREQDACERALALGIHEIAFTNHIMLKQPNYLLLPQACLAHWERIQACQQRFPEVQIRLGIEMDYYPGCDQQIADTLREYEALLGRPFDIVLGSVHELNGVFFSNKNHAAALYAGREPAALYAEYFALAERAVRSGLFDVMAHPDLIRKYTYELTPYLSFGEYRAAVEAYIEALLEMGVGMELNTKGMRLKLNEGYPSKEMLALYLSRARERGAAPILTLGSDAHQVDEVGGSLPEGAEILRGLGVKELSCFEAHKRSAWKL